MAGRQADKQLNQSNIPPPPTGGAPSFDKTWLVGGFWRVPRFVPLSFSPARARGEETELVCKRIAFLHSFSLHVAPGSFSPSSPNSPDTAEHVQATDVSSTSRGHERGPVELKVKATARFVRHAKRGHKINQLSIISCK